MTTPAPGVTKRRWVTRRRFLKVSAAAGGALALGFVLGPIVGRRRRERAIRAAAEATGEFRPNAWLVIHPDDRIVFTLDRVEMGQGTMTSHSMLIAEELEVDPTTIEVEFAVADRRYDHPEFGLQITGGSSSVRTSWEQLRHAGAVAREMLRAAASAELGVPPSECVASNGTIAHALTGHTWSYGALTRLAAMQPIPDPALKPVEEHTLIGTALDRVDAPLKVDGSGVFGIDVTLPGLLNAAVIRPPVQGATVASFDAGSAARRPGVKFVVEIPGGVAVVADRYWQARAAAEDVTVSWDGGRPELDTPSMTEELRRLAAQPGKTVRDDGDAESVLASAAGDFLEAVYDVPHLAHAPMEPQNCTAHVDGNRCEIWAPTQVPGVAREAVATALDLPHEQVVVHTTFLGGGFGRRLVADFVLEAAHLSQRIGGPVKITWSREDDMCHSMYRPQVRHLLRAVLGDRGTPVAWHHRVAAPSLLEAIMPQWLPAMTPDAVPGAMDRGLSRLAGGVFRGDWVADPTSTEGASDTPYAIENLRVELAKHDPGVPIGFWRSVGHSHTAFAVESFIDELAAAAGRDPFDYRRDLLRDAPRNRGVLEAAAEQAGWGSPLPTGRFRGIAQHFSFETYVAEVAEVSVEAGRIRVHRVVCAVDCGRVINPDIVRAQMESGVVFGLSAALKQRISYLEGHVEQTNFHDFEMLRMNEMPAVEVVIVPSTEDPTGVGEPGVPPIAPAVANAIAAATGRRVRTLPIERALLA
jgi:CO/xanthine dehydrogenase Mo-binding subunit